MNINDLLLNYFENTNYPRKSHYTSTLHWCMRKLYYNWIGIKESNPKSVSNYIKMSMGNYAEDIIGKAIQYACESGAIDAYQEQEKKHIDIGLKYPLSCKYDFMVYSHFSGKILLECKSSFGWRTRNMRKTLELPEEYLLQCGLYMLYFDTAKCIIPYISRDNGYTTWYNLSLEYISYDNMTVKYWVSGQPKQIYNFNLTKIIERLKLLETHIENKYPPCRGHDKTDYQCKDYCEYRDICWSANE